MNMNFEENYVPLVQEVLQRGGLRQGRNGNTHALFGIQIKADDFLGNNFP